MAESNWSTPRVKSGWCEGYRWIEQRLLDALRRRRRWQQTWEEWLSAEPNLQEWPLDRILAEPNLLSDETLRALIRIARSDLAQADVAVVIVLFTRVPALRRMRTQLETSWKESNVVAHMTDMILSHKLSDSFPVALQLNAHQAYVRRFCPELRRVTPQPRVVLLDDFESLSLGCDPDYSSAAAGPGSGSDQTDDELSEAWTYQVLAALADRHTWRPTDRTFEANAEKARAFVRMMIEAERLPSREQVKAAGLPSSCHATLSEAVKASLLVRAP